MDIITGYLGEPHVTSDQDRDINIGIVGDGSYVMPTGKRIAAEVSNNNEIRIRDGLIIHQGCAASIKKNTYDSVNITNGSQGMKRIDLIVARYQREVETNKETITLVVIQGTPAESDPAVPEHIEGDIQAGDSVADMPLYQVVIDGLNITEVKKVFEEITSLKELNSKIESSPESTLLGSLNLSSAVNTSVALSQSIDNFREILVIVSTGAAGLQGSWFRPVSKIDLSQEFNIFIQSQASYWQATNFKFQDKTHIQLTGKAVAGYTIGSMSVWGFK